MIIAIDFDGTCVTHEYPQMGYEIGAPEVIRKLAVKGHQLILFTMRTDKELHAATEWFKFNSIPLWGINENPEQFKWSQSRKVYASLYIDDAALGCPLTVNPSHSDRPFVDWDEIEIMLEKKGLI